MSVSEQTAIVSVHTTELLVFTTKTERVYCAVRAESSNRIQVAGGLVSVKPFRSKSSGQNQFVQQCLLGPTLRNAVVHLFLPFSIIIHYPSFFYSSIWFYLYFSCNIFTHLLIYFKSLLLLLLLPFLYLLFFLILISHLLLVHFFCLIFPYSPPAFHTTSLLHEIRSLIGLTSKLC